jgi:hypothetical protein
MTKARSNAVAEAAKGDLSVGSGTNLAGILAVGNNGETLVADSSTSTGLRYTAGNPIPNPVLNSAMQIAQRGTSFSLAASTSYTNGFTLDRWQTATSANQACTVSRVATGDTTNLPNIQYALRYQRNSGQTGTTAIDILQNFETVNTIPFAGKTITISFYARAGANFSPTGSLMYSKIFSGTGTDQNIFAGYAGVATPISTNVALTTTWQRFSYTGTLPSTTTEIALDFNWLPTGTAGANDYWDLTGVQIDIGSVALPFRTNAATIQGELAACQRYYWRTSKASGYMTYPGYGFTYSTTRVDATVVFPVPMRTTPTSVDYAQVYYQDTSNNTGVISPINIDAFANEGSVSIYGTVSGATAGRFVRLTAVNAPSATYLGFSAEL